ncbi:MAG: hypothetical protein HUK02_01390 [Bacteroidaceae bacterium]|nr:hypothetical protein [Bacteroidaceae bacterium]
MKVLLRLVSALLFVSLMYSLAGCEHTVRHGKMYSLLCQAEDMNRNYVLMDTLPGVEDMLAYFMKHGDKEEKMRSNYMMGCVFRDRGDSPRALQHFLKAVAFSDTSSIECDNAYASRILAQMGIIFHNQQYYQRELEVWQQAASLALEGSDTLMYASCLQYMAGAYYAMHDTANVLRMTKRAYRIYKSAGLPNYAASLNGVFLDLSLAQNNLPKAQQQIDEYIQNSGLVDSMGNNQPGTELFYTYRGDYYHKTHKADSALLFYRKLMESTSDWMCRENAYKGLMKVYGSLRMTDSVCKYAKLYADANDTANYRRSIDEVSRVQALFDYTEYQQEALRKSEDLLTTQRISFFVFVLLACVFGLTYCFARRHYRMMTLEIRRTNCAYYEALSKLEATTNELLLLRTNKNDLEKRKEDELNRLLQVVSAYQNNANQEQWQLEQCLQQHEVVKSLHNYASHGMCVPTGVEWKDFEEVVRKMLPDFYDRLLPYKKKLTEREFCMCLLSRVNFIPTEVAVLMNFSRQRVSNLRCSANQKVFGDHSSRTFDANIHRL